MVDKVLATEKLLGKVSYEVSEKIVKNRKFARSLFVVSDVVSGELITEANVTSIRPGNGLHPKYYNKILGKKFTSNVNRGEPLTLHMIESL